MERQLCQYAGMHLPVNLHLHMRNIACIKNTYHTHTYPHTSSPPPTCIHTTQTPRTRMPANLQTIEALQNTQTSMRCVCVQCVCVRVRECMCICVSLYIMYKLIQIHNFHVHTRTHTHTHTYTDTQTPLHPHTHARTFR